MNRNQANRARIAERVTGARTSTGTVATNPAMRPATVVAHCAGPIRRSRATKMTATQRNSEGGWSEWNASMHYFTDPKWSATCNTV